MQHSFCMQYMCVCMEKVQTYCITIAEITSEVILEKRINDIGNNIAHTQHISASSRNKKHSRRIRQLDNAIWWVHMTCYTKVKVIIWCNCADVSEVWPVRCLFLPLFSVLRDSVLHAVRRACFGSTSRQRPFIFAMYAFGLFHLL